MNPIEHLDIHVARAFFGQFSRLTPVQEAVLEPLLRGHNVVVSSGTGSGKTEAVMAPLINRLRREALKTKAVVVLYIAPTKALVNDLEQRLTHPLENLDLRIGVRHGDRDDLKSGKKPHVLITTIESLEVLLLRNDPALSNVRAVVIDEVHLLYNTQRGLQLSIQLKRLHTRLGRFFQWAALSATLGDLADIHRFFAIPGDDPVLTSLPPKRQIDALIRRTDVDELITLIRKVAHKKILIFTNSRRECERVANILRREEKIRDQILVHYSSLSRDLRRETEEKFKEYRCAVCVATSTLELGIDIGDVDAVLLWGVPGSVESFLQRIGRGCRRTHKTNAVGLIPSDSPSVGWDALRFAALVSAARAGDMPVRRPYELYGAVAQQILSSIASRNGSFTRIADLCTLVEHKPHLDRKTVEAILAQLERHGYLQRHGYKNRYGAEQRLYPLQDHLILYGNFGLESEFIKVYHDSEELGEVPAINLLRIRSGSIVRFGGKCWRVKSISFQGIILEPSPSHSRAMDFTYEQEGIQTDSFVAQRSWRLLVEQPLPDDLFEPSLREKLTANIERFRAACKGDNIPYIRRGDGFQYFTFAGRTMNKIIGHALAKTGIKAADDVSLSVHSAIDWKTLPRHPKEWESVFQSIEDMSQINTERTFFQGLLPKDLQLRESLQIWSNDSAVAETLQRLSASVPVQVDPNCVSFFA